MFKRNSGITLIELMTALFLSVLMMGVLITIYLVSCQNNEEQKALVQIQEKSRILSHALSAKLHLAGDYNCTKNKNTIKPIANGFQIEYFDPHFIKLIEMQDQQTLLVTKNNNFKKNDRLIMTDCQTVDIFFIKEIHTLGSNQLLLTDHLLNNKYESNAEISHLHTESYFIKQTDRKDQHGHWINALYIQNEKSPSEWIEGIDELTIAYDVLEQDHLQTHITEDYTENSAIVGLSLQLTFHSLNQSSLQKTEYLYVAI